MKKILMPIRQLAALTGTEKILRFMNAMLNLLYKIKMVRSLLPGVLKSAPPPFYELTKPTSSFHPPFLCL
ncbi:hypothetical cytosolic protein [Syntrophus aciditrophicus SB]|uniref:Hypothetical cytosolic protein n=1 Tax=Syntrophus aciditrophicus (strain SB) TaxID=56780 RepID=Q2LPP4_SYNAS|nr:hypothetical cytosolic protein [Syntrophus aciditrophicus SB]